MKKIKIVSSIRIEPDIFRVFKTACSSNGVFMSDVLKEMMENYIKEQGKNCEINEIFEA